MGGYEQSLRARNPGDRPAALSALWLIGNVGHGGRGAQHLRPEAQANLSETAWFCPFPRCEVAYFDTFERVATVDQLRYPVWPKDGEAPLCSCFGLTRDDVEQDIREGGVTRVARWSSVRNRPRPVA